MDLTDAEKLVDDSDHCPHGLIRVGPTCGSCEDELARLRKIEKSAREFVAAWDADASVAKMTDAVGAMKAALRTRD